MKFKDTRYYKQIKDNFYYNEDGNLTYDGNLRCAYNSLASLEFCPEVVNGYFDCSGNYLESLEYGPKIVSKAFNCSSNNLTSLEGCPEVINGKFYCNFNKLTSLEFLPYINLSKHSIYSKFTEEYILDYYNETYPEFMI